jgi:hypothetical protein
MTSEYRNIEAVNQSRLKLILKHPSLYINVKDDEEKEFFTFGQFVEDLLLKDDDYLDEIYFVTKTPTPTDSVLRVLKLLAEQSIELHLDAIDKDLIIQACTVCEYGKTWKPETCYNKILEAGTDYYFELKASEGKTRLSQDDYDIANKISQQALSGNLRHLFKSPDNLYKQVIEFKYSGKSCKGEIDILAINHQNKTVRVYDIKTSAQALYFGSTILKYRYDFQVFFYTLGAQLAGLVPEGYTILDPRFIVIDSKGFLPVTIWEAPPVEDITKDWEYNGRTYKGIDTAFDYLDFHETNNSWEYPMEYYEGGVIRWN